MLVLRSAALTIAFAVLLPDAARALAIIEIELLTGRPLSELGIEVSAVVSATITTMDERDGLLLPIARGGGSPGNLSRSFLGGLQLALEGAAATITEMEIRLGGLSPVQRTIRAGPSARSASFRSAGELQSSATATTTGACSRLARCATPSATYCATRGSTLAGSQATSIRLPRAAGSGAPRPIHRR
jgi:hypothetical protein